MARYVVNTQTYQLTSVVPRRTVWVSGRRRRLIRFTSAWESLSARCPSSCTSCATSGSPKGPCPRTLATDDTGWRVAGQPAQLMVFTTEQGDTLYQIRSRHRNEEVREVLPSDWQGTMVTERGRSYDAWQLAGVKQSKCSFHVLGSIEKVLDTKPGAARWFGLELKETV